jgi:hypothetical protein
MVHVGDLIVDEYYGYGIVLNFSRSGGEAGATVHFYQPHDNRPEQKSWGHQWLPRPDLRRAKLLSKSS